MHDPALGPQAPGVACSNGTAQPSGGLSGPTCPCHDVTDPQMHRVPSGVWPLGRDMHHGSASRLLEKGTKPCVPSGNWLSRPCGDAGTGKAVCPQNRGEQTRQRPLGLWLGLNPRARCQVEAAEANHTRLHRLLGDLWEAQRDSRADRRPPGRGGALRWTFCTSRVSSNWLFFQDSFQFIAKLRGKHIPAPPQSAAP